jgi:hypothetical protein
MDKNGIFKHDIHQKGVMATRILDFLLNPHFKNISLEVRSNGLVFKTEDLTDWLWV